MAILMSLAGMNCEAYHRQDAWAALLSVMFFGAVALLIWPWTRWALGALIVWTLLRPCVRIVRR